jgi:hypothetical protein
MITSVASPGNGSKRLPARNSVRLARPSISAFSCARATALGTISVPYTCAAPIRAATNERIPVPQPTSNTVSPSRISRASASVRLVWVGAKTPGSSSSENGPVGPFHSNVG